MIDKVNRPTFMALVHSTKQTENDPGSSQGGTLAYDGPLKDQSSEESTEKNSTKTSSESEEMADGSSKKPTLKVVAGSKEKAGMTDVIKNLLEQKKENETASGSRSGLTVRYQDASAGTSKGLLLNKKVE